MKKILILCFLVTLGFSKWVMIEGKHITNNERVMYIYNDQTGAIFMASAIYKEMKNGTVIPMVQGFKPVLYFKYSIKSEELTKLPPE